MLISKHVLLHAVDHISEPEEHDPDDDAPEQMHHGEDIYDEQEYSETDSEIDEHLLPPDLLESDPLLGDPRTESRQSDDRIHAEEIDQQGIDHQDDEPCGSSDDTILYHDEYGRIEHQGDRDDIHEELLHGKHLGPDDICQRYADRYDAPDEEFPVLPACEHGMIVRMVRHEFLVDRHSEEAQEQDTDDQEDFLFHYLQVKNKSV